MAVEVGKEIPEDGQDAWSNIKMSIPILVFGSIALYNVLELNYITVITFRRRKSLYFWSLIVATWGIAVNAIGYLLVHLRLISDEWIYSTLICIGWICMVTGQSVVLYSRLHLVMSDDRWRHSVLYMIIFNAIVMHIPVTVLVYGSNSDNPGPYLKAYTIYEKVQLSVFFIQECIISSLYVWETTKLLRVTKDIRGKRSARRVMSHLIFVNVVVIILDISVLALEFSDFYALQTGYKPLVYSVKLKMELSILNRLVELTRENSQASLYFSGSNGITNSINLDTFNSGPQRSFRNDLGGEDMGYKASVITGSSGGQPDLELNDISGARIVRETEVSVEQGGNQRKGSQGPTLEQRETRRNSLDSGHDITDALSISSVRRFVGAPQ